MNYGDDTLTISMTIEKAAFALMGQDAHEKLWTKQQVFDVAKECGVLAFHLPCCPCGDFTARAHFDGRAFLIYYNDMLDEDQIRIHVIGELAAALAMRDYPDRYRLEIGFAEQIARDMRRTVSVVADIMRIDAARLAA